ncbi:unnamed protein product [Ceratitis capitata]|uniref:(Mediterranean fruit fly) hypothetical protein n=1 Tax=Ceratitis capitata TaxID=7213 RepID=A0A811UGU3_CERCA|nr:unnamed protein product [Ceratitis capitata]
MSQEIDSKLQLILLHIILLSFSGAYGASQPQYQVSLYVSLHPRAPPIHYCNGVIVQSSLILTTASCTFYQPAVVDESGAPVHIPATKISVVPGVDGTYSVLNTFNVLEINIAPGFNYTTLENNLALLRLDTTLPLGQRVDVQWIIMDDYVSEEEALYMAGFPSLNTDPSSMLLESVQILPNEQCAMQPTEAALGSRNESICAKYPYTYPYAIGPDCEYPTDFPTFNFDYGTGLIARSHLFALFSHAILAPTTTSNPNANNCHEPLAFNAIFITVGPHLDWIYGIIASEEMLALHQEDFMYSAPYQQDVSSAMKFYSSHASATVTSLIEATTTTTTTLTVVTTTNAATTNPGSTEASLLSQQMSRVTNGAHKTLDVKFALLFYGLFFTFSAYFLI